MINMRPPPARVSTGKCVQIRPMKGGNPGKIPAPLEAFEHSVNKDSLLRQALQRGHEQQALPLLSIQRYMENAPKQDFAKHAFRPFLEKRPNPQHKILVRTYNY